MTQPVRFKTIDDVLRWAERDLLAAELHYGHGTNNAWDEAVYLTLELLGLPPDSDDTVLTKTLTSAESERLEQAFLRRIQERIPAAYLTSEAYFAGLSFHVTPDVLIPRSPVAELLQQGYAPWLATKSAPRLLDLCTGSGCIAIASAVYIPDACIDAVDISAAALTIAEHNCVRHAVQDRVQLHCADLFSASQLQQYDLIVSNPPYVSAAELAELPQEYSHEPQLGLYADDDGLALVIQILQQASRYLTDDGVLIVEVGNSQQALVARFPAVPFIWLEFAHGGDGVFLLYANDLQQFFA